MAKQLSLVTRFLRRHIPTMVKVAVRKVDFFLLYRCDREVKNAKRIIELTARSHGIVFAGGDPTSMDHQGNWVFLDRIQANPRAFKMSHWDNREVERLDNYPDISGRILDFGCGSGNLDVLLARTGRTIIGLDTSVIAISLAQDLAINQGHTMSVKPSFLQGDITLLETQALIHKEQIDAILVYSRV